MPRTASGLYEQIVSYDNLYAAYLAARKGKRYRGAAATYGAHLEENLGAAEVRLGADTLRRMEALIHRGSVSGERYSPATQAEIDTEEF